MENWWKHKLFQPKSIEGESAKEQLDYIRELFSYASKKDPRLKGITIIGSTLKGYARSGEGKENTSDIDIAIICDDSPVSEHHYDFYGKFCQAREELQKAREKDKRAIFEAETVLEADVNHLTPERIKKIDNLGTLWIMESLVFPGVGDLETYRNVVRNEINTYSKEEKEKWLKHLVDSIIEHFNSIKSLERGMITKDQEVDFSKARKKLIDARVRKIFA